tara:strand:- start:2875 stop:3846 length:972 start_codon:yes stop_codon:yes gene_type:complete
MKIYTEINYKWLDGQLVKTDDKSFEYEGEISFCAGAAGAAEELVSTVTDPLKEEVLDPVVEAVVEPVAEVASDMGGAATGVATDMASAISSGVGSFTETLADGTTAQVHLPPPTVQPPSLDVSYTPDSYSTYIPDYGTLSDAVTNVVTDPLGAATTGLGNLGENVGALGTKLGETTGDLTKLGGVTEAVATGTQNALQNLHITNLGSTVNDAMNVIGTKAGLGGNTLDALVSVGETLDDIMEPINEVGWAITDAGVDTFNWLNDTVAGLGQDLTQQIHGTQDPKTKVELEKMKGRKGKLKNKSRGQLRLNKSKGRARQSLRIG